MAILPTLRTLRKGPVIAGPIRIASAHKPTMFGKLAMERWITVSRSVDDRLKSLAQLRAASLIGCLW